MGKDYYRSTGYRAKKRKFHGRKSLDSSSDVNVSASAKKLKLEESQDKYQCDSSSGKSFRGYRVVDISLMFEQLQKSLSCKICHSEIEIKETGVTGISSTLSIHCSKCSKINQFNTSRMIGVQKNQCEVNLRIIYAVRCIGGGLASLERFCNIMDFPPPVSQKSYDRAVVKIGHAAAAVSKTSMMKAALEETLLSDNSQNITVSGDGTWKSRGFSSKIGVCTLIGAESGKVIDVEVLSSFCKGCEKNVDKSLHDCVKNHEGSAGKMEVIGMLRMFQRSMDQRNVRYSKYIGDGDTKTFCEISKDKPYGDDVTVEKLECIGHVQKRMGTRLRKLKADMKSKKCDDGKPLSGKGRLTDKLIDQLTVYYGNAIRANSGSLTNMRKAVWAIWCHTRSTDDEPMHFFCPEGDASWCKFRRHEASKDSAKENFQHKKTVPSAVMDCIKKVFSDLSSPQLLKRCLSGKTQNPNESLNSTIWKLCPKTSGCGVKIVKVAVDEAVIAFNEGSKGRLDVMRKMEVIPGENATQGAFAADRRRILLAEKRLNVMVKETRRAKRMAQKKKDESACLKEGNIYEAGGH